MTRRVPAVALVSLLAAAGAGPAVAGIARPELALELGRSFGVQSERSGWFDQGGFTASLAALWPWEDRFRFGVSAFAADFGTLDLAQAASDLLGDASLVEPFGELVVGHRQAWGAAWRVDALGPRVGRLGRSFASGSYGYFRLRVDDSGKALGENSGLGGAIGVGLQRAITPRHTLAFAASHTWMSDDFTRRYGSAGLEWQWRW